MLYKHQEKLEKGHGRVRFSISSAVTEELKAKNVGCGRDFPGVTLAYEDGD